MYCNKLRRTNPSSFRIFAWETPLYPAIWFTEFMGPTSHLISRSLCFVDFVHESSLLCHLIRTDTEHYNCPFVRSMLLSFSSSEVVRLLLQRQTGRSAPESLWDLDSTAYGPVVSLGHGLVMNVCCINYP